MLLSYIFTIDGGKIFQQYTISKLFKLLLLTQDVMHDSSSELQVEVTLYSLFGDGFGHALRVSTLELSG